MTPPPPPALAQPVHPQLPTSTDLAWWDEFAPTLPWRRASTYEDTAPHAYVVRDDPRFPITVEEFDRAVRLIRTYGHPGRFYNTMRIYLDTASGHRYWTCQGPVEIQGVINRCPSSAEYGSQDDLPVTAPPTPPLAIPELYDSLSTAYDERYTSETCLAENRTIRSIITRHFPRSAPTTLDLGCGTGLLLSLGITSPALYTGVDPSQGMLNELVLNHPRIPAHAIHAATAEEYLAATPPRQFDLVCALFGAASYLAPASIHTLSTRVHPAGLGLLMNYRPGYLPDYYRPGTALHADATERSRASLDAALALPRATHRRFHDFVVTAW